MKVTVCFGSVRVVVPCGDGGLLVSDLIEKSTLRYKKAIGKPSDYWVAVHNLKSSSDGGILDPDDQLMDVADDREQIIAYFEEQGGPSLPHNGGDGTSASSVGTSSPDIFQGNDLHEPKPYVRLRENGKHDVIINDLSGVGSCLIVRRGSEPVLTNIGKDASNSQQQQCVPIKSNKRWSAIASIDESKSPRDSDTSDQDDGTPPPPLTRVGGNGQDKERSAFSTFARDSTRRSLANNAAMLKWLDAQGKQQEKYEIRQQSRKEPLGGTDDLENNQNDANQSAESSPRTKDAKGSTGTVITLVNTGGPLGIHVVPHYEADGRDTGLMIQGIEPGGRVYRDGRLHVHDRIIEINGTSLLDVNFNTSQEIFKQALQRQDIQLRVIKEQAPPLPRLPPPVNRKLNHPSDLDITQSTASSPDSTRLDSVQTPVKGTPESPLTSTPTAPPSSEAKEQSRVQQPPSPTKKIPPAVPVRHPNTALSSSIKSKILAPTNTRKIGQKIHIQLSKGADGLGFSITSRDNLSGGQVPIYIKNILNKGAAKEEGTLSPGDRLLEVNGVEMTGKNQSDAVNVLRNIKMGSVVNLVVSRQVVEDEKVEKEVKLPTLVGVQPAAGSDVAENTTENKTNKEIMTLEIPLTESGSSGLGVSVKGKTATTPQGTTDLGIFIKAVISGGAASKDGRLRVNDQLMIVNNEPLFAKPNTDAMETLRKGMQKEGPTPGHIHLVIARRPLPCPASPKTSREMRVSRSEPPDKELASSDTESTSDAHQAPAGNVNNDEQVPAAKFRNPLLDRLTGGGSNALRNLSYQKANHDSILSSGCDSVFAEDCSTPQRTKKERMASPTINGQSSETVLIEDDNSQVLMKRQQQNPALKQRPASTLGFLRSAPNVPPSACKSTDDLIEGAAPDLPDWLVKECEKNNIDDADAVDETITVDGEAVFQREGFGRQSMSEKRKGHIDPKLSEFYQKLKQTKDKGGQEYQSGDYTEGAGRLKRAGSAESLLSQSNQRGSLHETKPYSEEVGPTLGLKKSSSLESLQTAVQEVGNEEESNTAWKPPSKSMVRGRGCNESFRAAVDRSYEGAGSHDAMETVEEESSESGSASQGQQSRGSSFSVTEGTAVDAAKKNKKKIKKEKEKDKGGIFKGLFKFGKNRKILDERVPQKSASELRREVESDHLQEEAEKVKRAAQMEHDRLVQEQLRRYQDRQHKEAPKQPAPPPGQVSPPSATNRADRIHQLRAEHQRRHQERHGQYPHDEDEEMFERQAQQHEQVKLSVEPGDHQVPTEHRVHEPYDRPSSRIGYVDPARYSHYQNLQEIQAQLHRHDYYQHQYQQYMGRAPAGLPPPAAHSMAPPAAYEPRHTPSPDMYGYYRVHAVYDPRPAWAHPQSTGSGRSASPSRARSQTPVTQVGYYPHPHHNAKSLATNYGPPPVVSNAPAEHGQYPNRLYADYSKTRSTYSKEPSYNSLPRRREHRASALYSSSSAQV